MMRFRITIRFAMIGTACIAVAIWWLSPLTEFAIVQTAEQLNVAIDGPGYFRVVDEATCEIRYTRSGRIEIDQDNDLNIRVDDKSFPIDPPIQVPSDTRRIEILKNGRVRAHTTAGPRTVGRFQVSQFSPEIPFDDPLLTNVANDRSGIEQPREPSEESGWIVQGFIERSPPSVRTIVAACVFALIASCVLNYLVRSVGVLLGAK